MARKFLTPIDLTGLELTNFKVQNLGTDPSAYGKGHTYYNTAHNELRVYDGSQWVAVGGAVEFGTTSSRPVAGNAGRVYADTQTYTWYLDNGTSWIQIGVNADDVASAISAAALTSTDGLSEGTTNLYYLDSRARAALSASSGISYNSTTGAFTADYTAIESQLVTDGFATASSTTEFSNKSFSDSITVGGAVYVGGTTNHGLDVDGSGNTELGSTTGISLSANNDITITTSGGDITLSPHGAAYIGSVSSNNQIATIGDISADLYVKSVSSPLAVDGSGNLTVDLTAYLTTSDASSTYLTQSDASSTYLSQSTASSTYLSQTDASTTYQTQSGLDSAVGGLGYLKSGDQYIQSVSSDFTVSGTELTINTSTLASDLNSDIATNLTSGSTYISNTSGVLDVNISALETQLQSDGYITGSEQYIQSVGSEFSVATNELTLNTNGTLYVNGSNQLAVQYGTGLTVDGSGFLEVDETVIATKIYVDGVAQGLRIRDSIDAAALVNVTGTYTDGTTDASGGLGIGATFTTTVSALDTATGDTDEVNDRIGLFYQSTATQNGIYTVTANDGTNVTLTRSTYEDNSSLNELHYGNFYFVSAGTSAGTGWVLTNEGTGTNEDIKIGTDPVEFTQFSGSGAYVNGNGISISGNTISAVVQGTEGMQLTSGGIGVNAGTGLEFNGSTGALQVTDYNIITKKYAETIGDGSATSYDVTHDFGTRDVEVSVYDTATYEEVIVDITRATTNKVTIDFAVAPSTNSYRVVVVG